MHELHSVFDCFSNAVHRNITVQKRLFCAMLWIRDFHSKSPWSCRVGICPSLPPRQSQSRAALLRFRRRKRVQSHFARQNYSFSDGHGSLATCPFVFRESLKRSLLTLSEHYNVADHEEGEKREQLLSLLWGLQMFHAVVQVIHRREKKKFVFQCIKHRVCPNCAGETAPDAQPLSGATCCAAKKKLWIVAAIQRSCSCRGRRERLR